MVLAVCAQQRFPLLTFGGALGISLQILAQPFKIDVATPDHLFHPFCR